ncbi:hypothetical protein D3C86_2210480 [compost metagenome]
MPTMPIWAFCPALRVPFRSPSFDMRLPVVSSTEMALEPVVREVRTNLSSRGL